jgi:hypothetical protein
VVSTAVNTVEARSSVEFHHPVIGALGRQHERQFWRFVANGREFGNASSVCDGRLGAGIVKAVREGIRAEQGGKRQRNGPELIDGSMDGGDLGHLWQQNRDPVPATDAVGVKCVGESVGGLLQPAEADGPHAAVGAHIDDRDPVRIEVCPTIADVDADIVTRRNLPTKLTIEFVVVANSRKHEGALERQA